MYSTPIYKYYATKGDTLEPPPSSHPILIDGYKLHPAFIAMVQDKPFSGLNDENPYTYLREFEHLCSCLTIDSMTQRDHQMENVSFLTFGKSETVVCSFFGKWRRKWRLG
jgi:hypothetical protein